MGRTADDSSWVALRSGALLFPAVLCAACTQSVATEYRMPDNRTAVVDCTSDLEHAQSTTAVSLRLVGLVGGPVSAARLTLGSRHFTSGTGGERISVGPSLMTEDFLRVDLLRPAGCLLARLEAKLAGQIQEWPVDGSVGPGAPSLAGYLIYNNESHHPVWCRFTEAETQAPPGASR